MKLKLYLVLFATILFIAGLIRFYELGDVPHGMTWDEAAIGYNGSAIWRTRRDEWLVRLPVSFRSFGDYKAPLAIYTNGVFTFLFGMNLWAVRLPFTLASLFAIAGFMLLARELFGRYLSAETTDKISLFGGWLLALSPWHIHYSRAGFESGMALALLLWGMWFWLFSQHMKSKLWGGLFAVKGSVLLALTIYTYHSAKIVTPLLVVMFALIYWKRIWNRKIVSVLSVLVGGALLIPFIRDAINGQGLQRLDSSILNDQTGLPLLQAIGTNLSLHLDPRFLIMGETTTLRHGGGGWGVLLPTTFALCVFGFLLFMLHLIVNNKTIGKDLPLFFISIGWILIGLLPAAIGEEIPHSNRALQALPGFLLLALLGGKYMITMANNSRYAQHIEGTHHEKSQIAKAILGTLVLLHALYAMSFVRYYFGEFAKNSADDFKDGYLEALSIVKPYKEQVDKILFTSDYGQPYIYALFSHKLSPIWYQGGSLNTYEFTDKITIGDLDRVNTVVVASGMDEVPEQEADHLIYGSDGAVRFKIYLPNKQE